SWSPDRRANIVTATSPATSTAIAANGRCASRWWTTSMCRDLIKATLSINASYGQSEGHADQITSTRTPPQQTRPRRPRWFGGRQQIARLTDALDNRGPVARRALRSFLMIPAGGDTTPGAAGASYGSWAQTATAPPGTTLMVELLNSA